MISQEDKIAYAEIDYIINNMDEEYIKKVPTKLLEFFKNSKDPDYVVNINKEIPLFQNDLQEYTFDVLNVINLNYWTTSLEKKQELKQIMKTGKAFYLLEREVTLDENVDDICDLVNEDINYANSTTKDKNFGLNQKNEKKNSKTIMSKLFKIFKFK